MSRTPSLRALAPWLALVALLAVPPVALLLGSSASPNTWLLAYLAQTATMIVFALSYNILLGETGLLSLGHAVHAGLGALIAARVFNAFGGSLPLLPVLPLLPLVGGIGGALAGVLTGYVSTRRAGTAFAMITLGIGELIAAAAWTLPDWFGGEAGVAIDRASGPALGAWTFGPAREAYVLIAVWCVLACVAMFALSRTPFIRIANAVRDNPVRAAAIGCEPRRVRYASVVCAAFFAGIAGTLGLINVELVSTESVGMLRSGAVLIATVIGGTGAFFGPVAGAVVLTFFSVAVASVTRAWLFYLGLLFVAVVAGSPDGLAGFAARASTRLARYGWRTCVAPWLLGVGSACAWAVAIVIAVQWAYARQFGADDAGSNGALANWLAMGRTDGQTHVAAVVALVVLLAAVGFVAARTARRRWEAAEAVHAEQGSGADDLVDVHQAHDTTTRDIAS
ncbi:branched-chain amino acid ABC transporter permease [Paraburkholderia sp.]|uniref:branched-chain amino acid ABC transporter permease n=1 Tax=Paraburkholderia sp. TaxID=1926495 RepID=UPI003D6E0C1A